MSKLFSQMQEAERLSAGLPANGAAVAELLTAIGAEAQTAQEATSAPLLNCTSVHLPPMLRPILVTDDEKTSTHSAFESYRSLRTKITRFQAAYGTRSIVVSSADPGEGKTVSALNLGISLAQLETHRVLLVDGDIRTGGLSGLLGVEDKKGLADVLEGTSEFGDVVLATDIPRLYAVGAGELLSSAADLFAGSKWKEFIDRCNETFNMVIVDCPPILGLADFDLISAACDGVLIVVRAGKTKQETLTEVGQHLQTKNVLGVILNGQDQQHAKSYSYYYYSHGKGKRHS